MKPWIPLALLLALAACDQNQKAEIPDPAAYDANATAHFCGMTLGEHPGPKGQAWVAGQKEPIWFASVRDVIAFTLLPEEPKDVSALYVTDMGKAPSWSKPAEGGWIDARKAFYVIGSNAEGAMGTVEAVPFGDRPAADRFVAQHGGRVVGMTDIPRDYILSAESADAPGDQP